MKVYAVNNDLFAINENLEIIKLAHLPSPYFFVDGFERDIPANAIPTNLKSYKRGFGVWKIEVEKPSEIYTYRMKFGRTYEADVPYLNRLFIDGVLEIADYREDVIAFIDIETNRSGEIISIYASKTDGKGEFFYGDEAKIIFDLMNWLRNNDIVVLLAWNGLLFDYPIIGKKIERYAGQNEMLYWSLINKLDYMFMYDRFVGTERKMLDYVAKANGLEGKVEYEGRVWDLDKETLEKYNKRDVMIMVELENRYKLMSLLWEIAKLSHLPLTEVASREHNGRVIGAAKTIIDAVLLRTARQRGVVLPTANHDPVRGEFEGAYIWAKPGIYEWVGVFDVNSLYPSIILNEHYAYDLIYEMLKEWYDRRFYYKKKWQDGDENAYYKQYAYKILINAMYGVMGYPKFRLFNLEYASKVTEKGREIAKSMKAYARDVLGYEPVYVDTDSVYIRVGGDDESEYKYIEKKLNEFISPYTLDWEKTYKRLFIMTRKRYAGITTEGKLDVKGLEMVRGDYPDIVRNAQRDIIEKILKDGYDKEWLEDYINDLYDKLYSGQLDDDLIIVKSVKESWSDYKANTPQLRAWKKLGNENVLFVEYYWVKGGDVEPLREGESPKNVDYRKYWRMVMDMVDRIRAVFVEQKSIFEFGGD